MLKKVDSANMQALPCTLHSPLPLGFLPLDLVSTKSQDVISRRILGTACCKGELLAVEVGGLGLRD